MFATKLSELKRLEYLEEPLKKNKLAPNKITNASGETFETPVINFENYKIWGLTLGFTLQFLNLIDIDIDIDDLYFRSA